MKLRKLLAVALLTLLLMSMGQFTDAGKPKKGGGGSSYDLIVLETVTGYAQAINEANEIVGDFTDSDGSRKPVCWTVSAEGVFAWPLSLGAAAFGGKATDITDEQAICGYLFTGTHDDSALSACVWPNALAEPASLPLGSFGERSVASAINENGVVVGLLWGADRYLPFAAAWGIRDDGTITDPLILGPGGAEDVNAGNLAVGRSSDLAFRWQLGWDGTTLTVVTADEVFDPVTFPSSTVDAVNDFGDLCGDRHVPNVGSTFAYLVDDSLNEYALEPLIDNRRTYTQNYDADSVNNANKIWSVLKQ